jgi:acylphosphatase
VGMVVRTCGRSRGRKIDTERRMPYGILDDGSVEVVAEGEKDKLTRLIDKLREGPRAARVERVDVEWGEPTGKHREFEIIF